MITTFCNTFYRFKRINVNLIKMIIRCNHGENSPLCLCYSVILGFLITLSACNAVTTSSNFKQPPDTIPALVLPDLPAVSKEEAARIKTACENWYDSVLKQKGFNGGILVAKNGHIIFERYNGTGHLPGTDTITENTPLHIASISKTFTAMAVLKLVQDGKLQLDDLFSKYFPVFNYPGITIRNLLSHRSGLPNYLYFMEELGWNKSVYIKNQDVLDYLISRKPELKDITSPGTHFAYCNTNYALLALLIEKVTSVSYAQFIKQSFFIPLHMNNSYIFNLTDSAKALPSYDWRGKPEQLNFLDLVYGDKNIYTTPRDLLIWDRALSGKLLFTKEILEQAYAPYSNERPGIRNYGLGWRMNIYPNGKKIIYHNGWWHGSNAAFIRLLNDNATIIVIGNKFTRSIYHAKSLESIFDNYYGPVDDEETETIKDLTTISTIKSDKMPVKAALKNRKNIQKKSQKKNRRSN